LIKNKLSGPIRDYMDLVEGLSIPITPFWSEKYDEVDFGLREAFKGELMEAMAIKRAESDPSHLTKVVERAHLLCQLDFDGFYIEEYIISPNA
jgi:hypothetical protein